jgi:hypothetical protein
MSDPHRTDTSHAVDAVSDPDRAAKVEQLLLDGLDCYFAARYEQAINIWSRALFIDRGHPRARAYIERARRALAERQREAEELAAGGVAGLGRGDAAGSRRPPEDGVARGGASEDVHAAPGRVGAMDPTAGPLLQAGTPEAARRRVRPPLLRYRPDDNPRSWWVPVVVIAVAGGIWLLASDQGLWRLSRASDGPAASHVPPAVDVAPELPMRAETALTRARMLAAGGRLHDAMTALDLVRPTDPQKAEADRLRADLQRRLIALTLPEEPVPADPGPSGAAVP